MVNPSSRMTCTMEGPSSTEVLRRQELSSYYQCRDYLKDMVVLKDASTATTTTTKTAVSPLIRAQMLDWVFKINSFLKLNDDMAILTATLLDRFLQTQQGSATVLTSLSRFRLATMACFYLTTKVHEHDCTVVNAEVMAALSHGVYSPAQVEEMEVLILKALDWHISPPTALAFVREFLGLIPCSVSTTMKESAYELCLVQIQRSCLDYSIFAVTEASTIAYVALQNALRSLGMDSVLLRHISDIFSFATHTDFSGQNKRLSDIMYQAIAPRHVVNKVQSPRQPFSFLRKNDRSTPSLSSSNNSSSKIYQKHPSAMLDVSPCGVVDRTI